MTPDPALPSSGDRHLFFAFSTFTGDREPFDHWYDTVHIRDILSADGMVGAQRFEVADTKPIPGADSLDLGHLALYDIEGHPLPFREEVKRQLMSGEMQLPDFLNPPFKTLILAPLGPPREGSAFGTVADWDDRHLFLAWTRRGEEAARWYEDEHIPALLGMPGVIRVQRFDAADIKPLPGVVVPDLEHLVMVELDGDPGPFRDELKRQLVEGELQVPDAVRDGLQTMILKPVSPYQAASRNGAGS